MQTISITYLLNNKLYSLLNSHILFQINTFDCLQVLYNDSDVDFNSIKLKKVEFSIKICKNKEENIISYD